MASAHIEWESSHQLIPYPDAINRMEAQVAEIIAGQAPERVWLLEHPPLYTAGTSAQAADLLENTFPLYPTGRGGQITYHGPGQRIAYVMLNLKNRNAMDIRAYVHHLEQWLIDTLKHFDIESGVRDGRVGVWTHDPKQGECKIAALGIRVRKWVTFHGIALNVSPNLMHYQGIVPCGIRGYGITSLEALGKPTNMHDIDQALQHEFQKIFG